jgi:hypothetical protein
LKSKVTATPVGTSPGGVPLVLNWAVRTLVVESAWAGQARPKTSVKSKLEKIRDEERKEVLMLFVSEEE